MKKEFSKFLQKTIFSFMYKFKIMIALWYPYILIKINFIFISHMLIEMGRIILSFLQLTI